MGNNIFPRPHDKQTLYRLSRRQAACDARVGSSKDRCCGF